MDLIFVTGNQKKLEQAKQALSSYDINLVNQKIDIPEIQETDVRKVAEFSAKFAANSINQPVVVTDAGYYIKALNGFPGPFIKFVNHWFNVNDLLRLMDGVTDRVIESPICVAYCEPGNDPVSFISNNYGVLAEKAEGEGSTIDKLYIPNGNNKPIGTLSENERLAVWNMDCWKQLANFLIKKDSSALKNPGYVI